METIILVDFRYNIAVEYKADFYSFGKPLNDMLFNHKGLEKVRHEGETYLFMFDSYASALQFVQYLDSIGLEFFD